MDNVLEHVVDPFLLLKKIKLLASQNAILMIEVPNDFSVLQIDLYEREFVKKPFWVVTPDHISYFNRDGLINLCKEAGWEVQDILTDYPIDFSLFNINTNYVLNPAVGKSCHRERIMIENLMHHISPTKTIEFYRALAELGLGREIIGFFKNIS